MNEHIPCDAMHGADFKLSTFVPVHSHLKTLQKTAIEASFGAVV